MEYIDIDLYRYRYISYFYQMKCSFHMSVEIPCIPKRCYITTLYQNIFFVSFCNISTERHSLSPSEIVRSLINLYCKLLLI